MILTKKQGSLLISLLRKHGFRELARMSGIPKTTLYLMNAKADKNYSILTLQKLADAADIPLGEFLAL